MLEELEYDLKNFPEKTKNTSSDDLMNSFYNDLKELDDVKIMNDVRDVFDNTDINFLQELNDNDFVKEIDDPLENTLKINTFNDDEFQEALNKIENDKIKEKIEVKEEVKKQTTLEESFVNCSILGFITLFSGFGWLFWFLHYIAF